MFYRKPGRESADCFSDQRIFSFVAVYYATTILLSIVTRKHESTVLESILIQLYKLQFQNSLISLQIYILLLWI